MAEQEQKIPERDARPPVVAILGHIDHGKSTLIDYIRKTNVTATEAGRRHAGAGYGLAEAGGITQHISAYEVTHTSKDGRERHITFLDTPGHEAFSSIRTRCANVADIAALIVSSEDGVKPQTLEVLKNIKECALPYLVVITKIDKPSANVLRTKQNLAENEIYVEGYGGNTPVVELSAKTGKGVDEFLDMIGLISELEAKTADRDALGSGVIIESQRDAKRGITAVGIIKDGTVRPGLFAAALGTIAPIRFLLDAEGKMVDELSFSSPVQIVGWDKMPAIGDEFKTFLKKEEALEFAAVPTLGGVGVPTRPQNGVGKDVSILPLVIKADTDVKSALSATGAVIFGFNTKVDREAASLAERSGITIMTFSIIYELTDKVKELLSLREPRIEVEEIIGTSKVLKLFGITKGKQVIGGRVLSGLIKRGAVVKIVRRETEIGKGIVKELQQSKVATDSASEGTEFGAMIESKIEVAPGDVLNATVFVTK